MYYGFWFNAYDQNQNYIFLLCFIYTALHEKIFIIFMSCSLSHMLATIKLWHLLRPSTGFNAADTQSLRWKKRLFAMSIASTIGLLLFFLKHRFYCHDLAFSWFALCEYIIACSNMAFHCTTMFDFPSEHFLVARGASRAKQNEFISWKLDQKMRDLCLKQFTQSDDSAHCKHRHFQLTNTHSHTPSHRDFASRYNSDNIGAKQNENARCEK